MHIHVHPATKEAVASNIKKKGRKTNVNVDT